MDHRLLTDGEFAQYTDYRYFPGATSTARVQTFFLDVSESGTRLKSPGAFILELGRRRGSHRHGSLIPKILRHRVIGKQGHAKTRRTRRERAQHPLGLVRLFCWIGAKDLSPLSGEDRMCCPCTAGVGSSSPDTTPPRAVKCLKLGSCQLCIVVNEVPACHFEGICN